MTLFNGICDNSIYGAGMPIICTACGGIVRGGLCLPCDLREKDLYNYDPNAYSFNNSNYFPQPQDENYLCNLCGNNSHDDYDCQQQFLFVYEQEPSYNQNYDDNYYPHESLSFPCCDYYGGSHETFQCQPDNQNVDFSNSDQIQTPQYPDVNPPSLEIKYDQSTSTDRPIFLNDNEDQPVQNKESLENSSEEIVVSNPDQEKEPEVTTDTELSSTKDIQPLPVQEPSQNSNICQLIREECFVEVPEQQKQNMEKTMLDLVKICHHKEFLCIHDDVDNLIESALDSKLLSINSINSQRLDKKEQEVKNVEEQPAGRRNLSPIQSTKELVHSLSMGYEHLNITPKIESDEVTESNAENLLPIPSKCKVTLEDEIECDMPAKDDCSLVFTTFSNPLFDYNDDLDSNDDESLPDEDVPAEEFKIYSNPLCDEDEINSDKLDPHCFNVESDFVESLLNRDTFIDFSSKFDFFSELAHIKPEIPKSDFDFEEEIRLIENLLYDNSFPRPPKELNAEITDTITESIPLLPIPVQDGNSQQEEFDIVTETDDVLPPSVDNDDDYDLLLEEADLFLFDDSIPSGIENVADDPEGDIRFLEELLIDDSILSYESYDFNFKDNPSIPRPPPEPPDVEFFFDLKPDVIAEEISDKLSEDKCFNPGGEIFVSTKIEDDDYFPFMFVI
nr:hypothetical protein [Tanacetum cinerariifolium]